MSWPTLRCGYGIVIGAIFVFVLWGLFLFSIPISIYIIIIFILIIGICSVIWGDKFILWFLKAFKKV